jgi:plasmid stabilization system protein ParE
MPRGDKSKYTDKQERKADHIAEGYEERGVSEKEAERRAWATRQQGRRRRQEGRRLRLRQGYGPSCGSQGRAQGWQGCRLALGRGPFGFGEKGGCDPQAQRRASGGALAQAFPSQRWRKDDDANAHPSLSQLRRWPDCRCAIVRDRHSRRPDRSGGASADRRGDHCRRRRPGRCGRRCHSFVLSLGALGLPGVGPVRAAGWLLGGAVTGPLAGGIAGALIDAGLAEPEAQRHAEAESGVVAAGRADGNP